MTAVNPFHGIHAATVAPMRADYSLDEAKLADRLSAPVPVEVLPFACAFASLRLAALGATGTLREGIVKDGPVLTDSGGFVIDCAFGEIADPELLEQQIEAIPGVTAAGLFTHFAPKTTVLVGSGGSFRRLRSGS